jgi:hypothetical protein
MELKLVFRFLIVENNQRKNYIIDTDHIKGRLRTGGIGQGKETKP